MLTPQSCEALLDDTVGVSKDMSEIAARAKTIEHCLKLQAGGVSQETIETDMQGYYEGYHDAYLDVRDMFHKLWGIDVSTQKVNPHAEFRKKNKQVTSPTL